jgi:hypothetical protein
MRNNRIPGSYMLSVFAVVSHLYLSEATKILNIYNENLKMGNFNYKQQYGVIVICKDEKEQQEIYETLRKMGLTLKVVTV